MCSELSGADYRSVMLCAVRGANYRSVMLCAVNGSDYRSVMLWAVSEWSRLQECDAVCSE